MKDGSRIYIFSVVPRVGETAVELPKEYTNYKLNIYIYTCIGKRERVVTYTARGRALNKKSDGKESWRRRRWPIRARFGGRASVCVLPAV